ncbi:TonB-dependent receptor plug domain-containing protein [Sphingobium nicotianae]|uniref:TonB-dependent receptor n=1 Tax=Sphingobium nicotianae TaxID=2782607 RepID=A0A9X1IRG6_9SPHN|nr:TonB-dependent receptor [Sphingobium nicotianae]MBT2187304.1 TonB-dependent receptor [Sphingobium nicotianae]
MAFRPFSSLAPMIGAALIPAAAIAQAVPAATDPAVVPPPALSGGRAKRVYTPADFTRFAPKTAYDLLVQVPGFVIRVPDQNRGLGQASENVLINSQRIANKSGGAVDELQKINAANIARIEIVEAASLGIAGLSGQVANVILATEIKSSGRFEWKPDFRAHYSEPNYFRGSISYTGKSGWLDYTLAVKNNTGRGAFGGPILLYDASGKLFETREEIYHGETEQVTFSTKFTIDGPGSSVGNLTLAYTPYWAPEARWDSRIRTDGNDSARRTGTKLDGWYYDLNADYEFALGPGRLKLIGVRHFDHEPIVTTQVTDFDSGNPAQGTLFGRNSRISETVLRGEYRWKTGANDWQLSLERAFNALDQRGSLARLAPGGAFEPQDFPEGTGKVQELRYEGIATLSRPLGPKLDLQIAGGGEISTLERVDGNLPARNFFRPKGSIVLGWHPGGGWDASLKLNRRVGQISFYDFLAQPKLVDDRENSGNPDLVPPQQWEVEVEVGKELGGWGKTRLRVYRHWVEDIVDIIPIGTDGEGVGNLPHATRFGMESTGTLLFDPVGVKGAKLDMTLGFERTSVKDPLTGENRALSGTRDHWVEFNLRHDIAGTPLAWGVDATNEHYTANFYLSEVYRSWEGPWFVNVYAEHKALFGLTVRAQIGNIFNARHRLDRTVYAGWRDRDPVAFIQRNNQLIGPIFQFTVRGNF